MLTQVLCKFIKHSTLLYWETGRKWIIQQGHSSEFSKVLPTFSLDAFGYAASA